MPILNFKLRFVSPIREKRKAHTIRAKRKIRVKVGDKLYLYCGLRRKGAFRILPEPTICSRVQEIKIRDIGSRKFVFVDGETLMPDECEQLACADGFENFKEMMEFWKGRLPFEGDIIHWKA
jgi:hypothetical protein